MRFRSLLCFLLTAFLLLGFLPGAMAAPGVYFTMTNSDAPEPLDAHTMPFNRNGIMYVPASSLRGLGITATQSNDSIRLSLDRDGAIYVHFDLEAGTNVTNQGDSLAVTPLLRFGSYFFPVGGTTTGPLLSHFGADYRLIPTEPAPIVRLYNENRGVLSHNALLANGNILFGLTDRLNTYLGEQPDGEIGGGTVTPTPPPTPPPTPAPRPPDSPPSPSPTEPPETGDDRLPGEVAPRIPISVSFVGLTEETESLLNDLYRWNIPAGFFVTAEDIEARPDLVRRLHGEGHQLGIYLAGDAAGEYMAASEALFEAARLRTVLVVAADEETARQAEELGVIVYGAHIIRQFNGPGELPHLPTDLLLDSNTANPDALTALAGMLRSGTYRVMHLIHSIFTF